MLSVYIQNQSLHRQRSATVNVQQLWKVGCPQLHSPNTNVDCAQYSMDDTDLSFDFSSHGS